LATWLTKKNLQEDKKMVRFHVMKTGFKLQYKINSLQLRRFKSLKKFTVLIVKRME